jgi:hypothetical protein
MSTALVTRAPATAIALPRSFVMRAGIASNGPASQPTRDDGSCHRTRAIRPTRDALEREGIVHEGSGATALS